MLPEGIKFALFCMSGWPQVQKVQILCPRVPFFKRSAKKSYLIVLSWCSFLSLTCKKHNFLSKNLMCLVLWTVFTHYFVKFCPATFFHGKKVNFTYIHAKKVFFNAVFNGKNIGHNKKSTLYLHTFSRFFFSRFRLRLSFILIGWVSNILYTLIK